MKIAESRRLRACARGIIPHRVLVALAIGAAAFPGSRIGHLPIDPDPDHRAPRARAYVQAADLLEEIFTLRFVFGGEPRDALFGTAAPAGGGGL